MTSEAKIMLELGQLGASAQSGTVYVVESVGAGVVVLVYDAQSRVGGMACISLPESKLDVQSGKDVSQTAPAKYADLAVPLLIEEYLALGGSKNNSVVRLVGGAQLFNFGGGGGNLLNIGVRNAMAIRAALSKQGFVIEKADTGGNKPRSLRFELGTGNVYVRPNGSEEYLI